MQLQKRIVPVMFAAGAYSFYVCDALGALWGCGGNSRGQLGIGDDTRTRRFFGQVQQAPSKPRIICASWQMSFYVCDDAGNLFACGCNEQGQLGLGDGDVADRMILERPLLKCEVVSISAGDSTLYIMDAGGRVFVCGSNRFGELGLGDLQDRHTPVHLTTACMTKRQRPIICAKATSFYFVDGRGSVFSCGLNDSGQLAVGDTVNRNRLTPIAFKNNGVRQICAGQAFVCILCKNGELYSCGANLFGQLGFGDKFRRTVMTRMPRDPSLPRPIAVCASAHSLYMLDKAGDIYACGLNSGGELGLDMAGMGSGDLGRGVLTKIEKNGAARVKALHAGRFSLFVVDCVGDIFVCGFYQSKHVFGLTRIFSSAK